MILEVSKTLMYEFWYDYIKQKYQQNTKQCYIDSDSFIIHVKTEDIYEDIADDVKKELTPQIIKLIDHCLQVKTKRWLD